jgi:hypothetical protein
VPRPHLGRCSVGQNVYAAKQLLARFGGEPDFLRSHDPVPLIFGIAAALGSLGGRARLAFDHAQDVTFFENEPLFPVDDHVRARPFAEKHTIADFHVERNDLLLGQLFGWREVCVGLSRSSLTVVKERGSTLFTV